jgi:uncharacterized protein
VAYPILDPKRLDPSLSSVTALAIMAKAPQPGKVKTRLSPPLTPEQSAAINICFLRDSTMTIAKLSQNRNCAGVISYTPVGDEHLFEGILPAGYQLIPQRGEGFGERLFATAEDLLACGFQSVCLIDSDSPTVPEEAYALAVESLQRPGDGIVLGPSHDGGYYLIGMKKAHREPFEKITWSTSVVFEETVAAIKRIGVELVTLPLWYDVDDRATLQILREELIDGKMPDFVSQRGCPAENSRQFLESLQEPA